jgi:AIPR protein
VDGAKDLLGAKLDRFNAKIKAKEAEIKSALYCDRDVGIALVTAHTAVQPMGSHGKQKIDDFVADLNNPVPIANAHFFNQASIYRLITADPKGSKIDLPVALRDWGSIERPFMAYYGRVHLSEARKWWNDHNRRICDRNLRHFFQSSDVNNALRKTLEGEPQHFWYFNNGITIICDKISKSLAGAPDRKIGLFNCEGVSVVNGAQTVGMIGTVAIGNGDVDLSTSEDPSVQAWVHVRIISLENAPAGFDRLITRSTNFQNAVGNRDFAALDSNQHRLATEFALDQRKYVYKSGENDPRGEEGCSITEATQALACAHPVVDLAVEVKREIGGLWADTGKPPYTSLFNDSLTSATVWKAVRIMRVVEDELQTLKRAKLPRADMVATHLHRIILHLVFREPELRGFRDEAKSLDTLIPDAKAATHRVFPCVTSYIETYHPGEYLASLCKNGSKCSELADRIYEAPPDDKPTQMRLFVDRA